MKKPDTNNLVSQDTDVVLSSGYLAMARHLGLLEAIEFRQLTIRGIVGTSSGALVGALWAAGLELGTIATLVSAEAPFRRFAWSPKPWSGLSSSDKLGALLEKVLPRTFEELPRPLALGVCDQLGEHRILTSGPLVPAVLASLAIRRIFQPVPIDGMLYSDGAAADRVAVNAWRLWRPNRAAIIHIVDKRHGREVPFQVQPEDVIVRTPKAHASLWGFQNFYAQKEEARSIALLALIRSRQHET